MTDQRGSSDALDGHTPGGVSGITVGELYTEIGAGDDGADGRARLTPDQQVEPLLNRVVESTFDGRFRFDESIVKENLDEILLLLVAGRSAERNGKVLMSDLTALFDTHMSPGTVYPQLHELEEEGVLDVHELVQTKEYSVADDAALVERTEQSMRQHLAMGLFMRAALAELL